MKKLGNFLFTVTLINGLAASAWAVESTRASDRLSERNDEYFGQEEKQTDTTGEEFNEMSPAAGEMNSDTGMDEEPALDSDEPESEKDSEKFNQ